MISWFKNIVSLWVPGQKKIINPSEIVRPSNMSRRSFLQALGVTATTVCMPGVFSIPDTNSVLIEDNGKRSGLSDQEKEAVIAQALLTEEGRTALAQAMVFPIRRSLEYQAVGRKLLMVDELSQGSLQARYRQEIDAVVAANMSIQK